MGLQLRGKESVARIGYSLEKAQVVGIVGIVGIVGMVGIVEISFITN